MWSLETVAQSPHDVPFEYDWAVIFVEIILFALAFLIQESKAVRWQAEFAVCQGW